MGGVARSGNRSTKSHLRGPAEVDDETDGTGGLGNGLVVLALVGGGVGADGGTGTLGDGGTLLTLVVANLHTGDVHAGELGDNAGDVPAGVSVVLGVGHVELTPGGGVFADVVGGHILALGGTPSTLRVVVDGDVDAAAGLDGEVESLVGAPETVQATAGTVGVPHDDGPGLGVVVLETDDVLVAAGGALLNLDHVATPGATDVADVVPVEGANALAGGGSTESGGGVLAVRGVVGPVARAGGRRAGGNGGGADRGDSLGLAGRGGGGGGSGSGGRSSSGLNLGGLGGRRLGRLLARPLVDPGDQLAIDGSNNLSTKTTLLGGLRGGSHGSLIDLEVDINTSGVGVTTVVAVETSDGGPSGQRRHQQHRVGEVHF